MLVKQENKVLEDVDEVYLDLKRTCERIEIITMLNSML